MKKEIINAIKRRKVELEIPGIVEDYVAKLLSYGRIITMIDKGLFAFVAFYCNDYTSKCGFISMIVVDDKLQNKGIGQLLLDAALFNMKNSGFLNCKLKVLTSNEKALSFYKKNGFKVIESEGNFLEMIKELV